MLTRRAARRIVRTGKEAGAVNKFQTWEARRRGFALVELLVVIAIIGILVAMLMPAVQSARESARKAQCMNNLKQLANAAQQHESAQGFLPTGGWGWDWVGNPDRGFSKRQPGGSIYNVLPYVGEQALHDLGKGLPEPPPGSRASVSLSDLNLPFPDKQAAMLTILRTPLSLMNCPSRRRSVLYPMNFSPGFLAVVGNAGGISMNPAADALVARSDYAANAGSAAVDQMVRRPANFDRRRRPRVCLAHSQNGFAALTGVCFERSEIKMASITDGASNTIFCGEKYLNPDNWLDGMDGGDNENMYTGFNCDQTRATDCPPQRNTQGLYDWMHFGSVHYGGAHFAMCDGSIRRISYGVNAQTFQWLGTRNDGNAIDPTKL